MQRQQGLDHFTQDVRNRSRSRSFILDLGYMDDRFIRHNVVGGDPVRCGYSHSPYFTPIVYKRSICMATFCTVSLMRYTL
jgi:hypothetical protein